MSEPTHEMLSETPAKITGGEAEVAFVPGELGSIETLTIEPADDPGLPTFYFLVGWWGGASDYLDAMRYFAKLGFRCRTFSWRGTGRSEGRSFWGLGYERDLVKVLEFFCDDRMVLIAHSGATDYLRKALPMLTEKAGIEAVMIVAPLARSGSMNALWTWLKPDRTGTTIYRWWRFVGSNFLGVSWFMRHELALRRVLLAGHVSHEVVHRTCGQIDACPYGRYFLSLWRFMGFLQPPVTPLRDFGIKNGIVFHCELDRNFTAEQQRGTAAGFQSEFEMLPGAIHQWFAEPATFEIASTRMLQWLAAKGVIPSKDG